MHTSPVHILPYIVCFVILGGSLTETINEQKRMTRRLSHWSAVNYFKQILKVLQYLQRKNVLHEDLKGEISTWLINHCLPWLRSSSGQDFGSEDPGLIPSIPSRHSRPPVARKLRMSLDILMPVSGWAWHVKDL